MGREIKTDEGMTNKERNCRDSDDGNKKHHCVEDLQNTSNPKETKFITPGDIPGNFKDHCYPKFYEIKNKDFRNVACEQERKCLLMLVLFCIIVSLHDILNAIFIIPEITKKTKCAASKKYSSTPIRKASSFKTSVNSVVVWLNSLFTKNEKDTLPPFETVIIYPLGADLRSFMNVTKKSTEVMMENNWIRLSTFVGFPADSPVSTLRLSDAGFYYPSTGSDQVKCFKCGVTYKGWKHNDEPLTIHKSISPSCKFIEKKPTSDVTNQHPIQRISENAQVTSPISLLAQRLRIPHLPVNGTGNVGARPANKVKQNTEKEKHVPALASSETGNVPSCTLTEVSNRNKRKETRPISNCNKHSASSSHIPKFQSVESQQDVTPIKPRYAMFSSFKFRLQSYKGFPKDLQQKPEQLAHAGFFYEGKNDRVKCFSCGKRISDWKIRGDPWIEHSETCAHLRQYKGNGVKKEVTNPSSNGRAIAQSSSGSISAPGSATQNISSGNNESTSALPASGSILHEPQRSTSSTAIPPAVEPLGVTTTKPKYPNFAVYVTRLQTYKGFPKDLNQKPEDLAKAGFFYEGKNDNVRCFYCGGGLRDWEPEDDVWTEHARWFQKCVYVRQSKGDEFVRLVHSGQYELSIREKEKEKAAEQRKEDIMQLPAVAIIIEMGYDKYLVQQAYRNCATKQGHDNVTAEVLIQMVWQLEEEGQANVGSETTSTETEQSGAESQLQMTPLDLSSSGTGEQANTESMVELEEENRILKEQQMCKICMEEEAAIVFLPCGHMVTCVTCAAALSLCPICRTFIRRTIKAIVC